jgi:hypothetical protein
MKRISFTITSNSEERIEEFINFIQDTYDTGEYTEAVNEYGDDIGKALIFYGKSEINIIATLEDTCEDFECSIKYKVKDISDKDFEKIKNDLD